MVNNNPIVNESVIDSPMPKARGTIAKQLGHTIIYSCVKKK